MSTHKTSSCYEPVLGWLAGLSLAWACCVPAAASLAQVKSDTVAAVLDSMRQAAGRAVVSGRPAELLIEGTADRAGRSSDFSARFAPDGKFLETLGGPLPGQLGFNGKTCWATDLGGMPERLELHDLDRNRLWLGMRTGQWLRTIDLASVAVAKTKSPRAEVILEVKQGRFKARVHVSRETWLPKSLDSSGVEGPETWTFADYRQFAGLNIPGIVTRKQAGQTETYRIKAIEPAPAAPEALYDQITIRPDDTRFDAGAPASVAIKRAVTGHVLARPKVDGRDLGWFIVDTGAAGSVLDPKAMAKLKLKPLGSVAVVSPRGRETSSIARASSFALGPMTIAKPFFVTMQLDYIRDGMGEDVFGIVGHDILNRCVVEVALADDSVKLYDPKTYQLKTGNWQALTFNQSVPLVAANFEGDRKGLFRIDLGSSGPNGFGNVIFHAPAVDEFHLLDGRKVTRMPMGQTNFAMGTVAWFEIAGHRFDHPQVVFATERKGPFGDEYVEGNIGVDFLTPFRLVFDFQNARAAFSPRGSVERTN
jgi:hypothetical protein